MPGLGDIGPSLFFVTHMPGLDDAGSNLLLFVSCNTALALVCSYFGSGGSSASGLVRYWLWFSGSSHSHGVGIK